VLADSTSLALFAKVLSFSVFTLGMSIYFSVNRYDINALQSVHLTEFSGFALLATVLSFSVFTPGMSIYFSVSRYDLLILQSLQLTDFRAVYIHCKFKLL